MFGDGVLRIEAEGSLRIVTLCRPDALNAVDAELHNALAYVWDAIDQDRDARAVVLTGEGRAFCAGGDIGWLKELAADSLERRRALREGKRIVTSMLQFPLPVVAAINGPAVGLGCSIAVMCDCVLMSERAFLQDPHVSVGLTAADGGAGLWPAMIHVLAAKYYLLTGSRIPADEAVRIGLANRVVPLTGLADEARAVAGQLASMPQEALQDTKRAINLHLERALVGVLDYGFASESETFVSESHRSALARLPGGGDGSARERTASE